MSGMRNDGSWDRLVRALDTRAPVRARVTDIDDLGAIAVASGVEGRIPVDEIPFAGGGTAADLEGRRVRAFVTAARPETGELVLSPRALALHECEARRDRGRRAPVRVVASGEHGVLAEAGGLRAWFSADDPPRRAPTGRLAGWVAAVTPHLVYLGGRERRLPSAGALTEVVEGTVTAVEERHARVRLAGAGISSSTAVLPRAEIAWHPVPAATAELAPGQVVRGCVVDLGLDGPVLSLRAATPSPWPAIALELTPGTPVRLRVRAITREGTLVRLVDQPHVTTLIDRGDLEPGEVLTAVVGHVDVGAAHLALEEVRAMRA